MKGDEQICWSCNKACAEGCCWFRNNEPVPNWIAIKTKIKATAETGNTYYISSYKIQRCPLYRCDNPIYELPTKVLSEVIGVTNQTILEWKKTGKLEEYLNKNKRKLKKLENYYVNKF